MTAVVMEPFDPFASDYEGEDDGEENNLFSQRARQGVYEEELYNEVETTHLPPLGLGDDDEFDFDEEDEESVSQHEDVFGMSLADVDLWDDEEDDDNGDPFAASTQQFSQNIEFPEFAPIEQTSEKKRDSLKNTSSKSRISSSSKDGKRRSSTSSSRNAPHRSKSVDDVELLAPDFSSSFTTKDTDNDRRERRSHTSSKGPSRPRQPPPRSKSSNYAKDDFGDQDRIGELLDIIKREKAQENTTRKDRGSGSRGSSDRSDRNKHHHSTSADGTTGSSLRQKLMTDKAATASSDRRRMSSSAASTSSGKRVSSKEMRRPSYDETMSSWNDKGGEKRHPPRRTSSKTNGSKSGDGRVGLDSFMKSNRPSRRGDAEHRSVVSAPATTSAETLSKKCQEMKLTF